MLSDGLYLRDFRKRASKGVNNDRIGMLLICQWRQNNGTDSNMIIVNLLLQNCRFVRV